MISPDLIYVVRRKEEQCDERGERQVDAAVG